MFSIITIASSTTKPVEMVRAMRERSLRLYPRRYITANVPISENLHVNGRGERGLELPEKLFHAVHDGDDVCAGLALNIENDGGILVGPGSLPGVFHAIDNRGDVGQPYRSAVAVRDDERAVTVAGNKLIVRADGVGLMEAVEGALGHVDVGLAQRGAQILETQTVRSQRRGIGLDAHGRALSTADTDKTDTGELRNFLGEGGVGE